VKRNKKTQRKRKGREKEEKRKRKGREKEEKRKRKGSLESQLPKVRTRSASSTNAPTLHNPVRIYRVARLPTTTKTTAAIRPKAQ
jgi:hypothetical protein